MGTVTFTPELVLYSNKLKALKCPAQVWGQVNPANLSAGLGESRRGNGLGELRSHAAWPFLSVALGILPSP